MTVAGRVAVIAGVGHPVSNAIARRLVEQGACVVLGGDDPNALLRASSELYGWPPERHTLVVMARDDAQSAEDLVQAARQWFGRIDIAISAWAYNAESDAAEPAAHEMERNLYGALYLAQAAGRAMRPQRRGRVITVSAHDWSHAQTSIFSAAAQAGVSGLTHQLADELGRYGITANCLVPAASQDASGLTPSSFSSRQSETLEQIAHAVLFLASDDAQHITGQMLALGDADFAAPCFAEPAAAV